MFHRFGAKWTPTILLLDGEGEELYRMEGFLPPDDFLAQLRTGYGHVLFAKNKMAEAERIFRAVVAEFPQTDAAPEAAYWAGVAKYKGSGKPEVLKEAAQEVIGKYPNTTWAKRASVWAA